MLLDLNHIQELTDTLGHDTLAAMVPGFIESTVTYRDAIVTAANSGNLRDARRSAHALKGLCAQFGAQRLAQVARAIEYDADSPAAVFARLPELNAVAAQTNTAVRERFGV